MQSEASDSEPSIIRRVVVMLDPAAVSSTILLKSDLLECRLTVKEMVIGFYQLTSGLNHMSDGLWTRTSTEATCSSAKGMAPGRRGTWAVLPGARGMMGNGIVLTPRTAGGFLDVSQM